jgi:hypothetical protein
MWESTATDAGNLCYTHSIQKQGFNLIQRPLHEIEREKDDLIEKEMKLDNI